MHEWTPTACTFLCYAPCWDSCILLYVPVIWAFSLVSTILLYDYATICLSIHLLTDLWIASTFAYYEWNCCKYQCVSIFWGHISFSLRKICRSKIDGFMVSICLTLCETDKLFSEVVKPLYTLISHMWVSVASHPNCVSFNILIVSGDVQWNLIVTSLMADVEHLFKCLVPNHVCSSFCPIL